MATYYQLNYQRKPEHLQWWLPKETPKESPLTKQEREERWGGFAEICAKTQRLISEFSATRRNAFEELVAYPVQASAAANVRFLHGEAGEKEGAEEADRLLTEMTRLHNETIAGGKWRGFMQLEPADNDWKSMRIARWEMPTFAASSSNETSATNAIAVEAENFSRKTDHQDCSWQIVPGLGRTGRGSITLMPFSAPPISVEQAREAAPVLEYDVNFPEPSNFTLRANLIPTHPISGDKLRFAVALDDDAPQLVELAFKDGSADWAQGVLSNTRVASTVLSVPTAGAHTLRVYGIEAGVVIDKFVLFQGEPPRSYLGPAETRVSGK